MSPKIPAGRIRNFQGESIVPQWCFRTRDGRWAGTYDSPDQAAGSARARGLTPSYDPPVETLANNLTRLARIGAVS